MNCNSVLTKQIHVIIDKKQFQSVYFYYRSKNFKKIRLRHYFISRKQQRKKRYVFDINERKRYTKKKHIIALKYFDMTQK